MANEEKKQDVQVGLMSGVMDLKLRCKALRNQVAKYECFTDGNMQEFEIVMEKLHTIELFIASDFFEEEEAPNVSEN